MTFAILFVFLEILVEIIDVFSIEVRPLGLKIFRPKAGGLLKTCSAGKRLNNEVKHTTHCWEPQQFEKP